MQKVILGLLGISMLCQTPIWAAALKEPNKQTVSALMVRNGDTILIQYGRQNYKVYAALCNELITETQRNTNDIILNPGDPIEIQSIDIYTNILILYSLPCN
ncbi:MAG: hypothetical protein WD512_18815 [Candidatus Paceibacterota bacterium]